MAENMRVMCSLSLCAIVGVVSVFGQTSGLSENQVAAAIAAGNNKRFSQLVSDCVATTPFGQGLAAAMDGGIQPTGSFDVVVSGAEGRIAFMASEGKRLYKPLTAEAIPEPVRSTNVIFVTASPHKPAKSSSGFEVASPIESIVLKSKVNPAAVVHAKSLDLAPVEWANLVGGKVQANSAVATFTKGEIKELPSGDFDVVLITVAGERRCKVGASDRLKILK